MLAHAAALILACTCNPLAMEPPAAAVVARTPTAKTTIDNAALVYHRSWLLSSRERGNLISEESYNAPEWRPKPEVIEALVGEQESIREVLKAATITRCDFGIDYNEGFETLLPHLGKMRHSTRVLAADARRLMLAGESEPAAERIAAIYAMSHHIIDDHTLISSLVSVAIAGVANTSVERLLEAGMTDKAKATILTAIAAIPADDTFGIKRAIQGEQRIAQEWIKKVCVGPEAGATFLTRVAALSGGTPDEQARQAQQRETFGKMNQETLWAQVDRIGAAYEEMLAAFDAPDGAERAKNLSTRVSNGEYGPVGQIMIPAVDKCIQSNAKGVAALRETTAKLRSAQTK